MKVDEDSWTMYGIGPVSLWRNSTPYQIKIGDEMNDHKNLFLIDSFKRKLKRLGIEIEMSANYPWIYLDSVNGIRVYERFQGNHGFTAFFLPVRIGIPVHFTCIRSVFQKIREMIEEPEKDFVLRAKQAEEECYEWNGN